MLYTREILDRSTGQLNTVLIGDWITVTELGKRHGVGERRVRAILYHMGLLHREGRSYRLPRWAVEKGLGIRHDRPKSGYPFDVVSPLGQELVTQAWDETAADYQAELWQDTRVDEARAALDLFRTTRISGTMGTQAEVCWLRDHFSFMTYEAIAKALEVSPTLVRRYAEKQSADREFHKNQKIRSAAQVECPARSADALSEL
jgi:hypothetical protein